MPQIWIQRCWEKSLPSLPGTLEKLPGCHLILLYLYIPVNTRHQCCCIPKEIPRASFVCVCVFKGNWLPNRTFTATLGSQLLWDFRIVPGGWGERTVRLGKGDEELHESWIFWGGWCRWLGSSASLWVHPFSRIKIHTNSIYKSPLCLVILLIYIYIFLIYMYVCMYCFMVCDKGLKSWGTWLRPWKRFL